ncbi:MAG: hypothetical protein P4N59_17750 [Negativicutes bacterium]|nr:hypothetical protein [Negativicutes bacterium]
MARSVACYEGYCEVGNEHVSNIAASIVLAVVVAAALGVALYSNAAFIGTEILDNPFFTVL